MTVEINKTFNDQHEEPDKEDEDEWSNVPKIEAKYVSTDTKADDISVELNKETDVKITHSVKNQILLTTKGQKNNNNTKSVDFCESVECLLKSFNMYDHFDSLNNKHYYHSYASDENANERRNYVDDLNRNFLAKLFDKLFGPVKLNEKYIENRDFIYLLVSKKFDDNCEIHRRILFTIYKKLTNTVVDCQRHGHHWEIIGFQGILTFLLKYVKKLNNSPRNHVEKSNGNKLYSLF
jgi:hypothetical protein